MNNVKNISIKEFLARQGILPKYERGSYGMYLSPLREEVTPSFKVDYVQNLWHDFGTGEGGSIIDFVMKLEKCSLAEAFQKLEDFFSFHRNNTATPAVAQESAIKIIRVSPLVRPALLGYLSERSVNIGVAKHYCSEVHYSIADKPYFAIGFKNDSGGWELRNAWFKGSSTPKNITTIDNGSDTVMVFEGFMDFLSYLSLKGNPSPTIDTAVLNSVANLKKAIPLLKAHRTVHAFLDNDEAGRKVVEQLREFLSNSEIIDQSAFYRNHKDLNDYWRDRKQRETSVMNKPSTPKIQRQISVKKKGGGQKL